MNATTIQRMNDPRFGALRDAFAANFVDDIDQGVILAAIVDGQLVIDQWGGLRTRLVSGPGGAIPWSTSDRRPRARSR